MTLETRDIIAIVALIISLTVGLIGARNARRSTNVQLQQVDLTRIRDMRTEVKDALAEAKEARTETRLAREETAQVRAQMAELANHLTQANDRAITYARREAEMLNWARMPGMDIQRWLNKWDPDGSHEIGRE